jgi:hypothetical protein
MKNKALVASIFLMFLNGCAIAGDRVDSRQESTVAKFEKLPVSYALQGTNTAVVGIAIDKKGYPLETVKEIILNPGQKVIFAGPDEFQISFKNRKSPNSKLNYRSEGGVVTIRIPRDILERPEFSKEYKENNYIKFNYSIKINGHELDPPIVVKREN